MRRSVNSPPPELLDLKLHFPLNAWNGTSVPFHGSYGRSGFAYDLRVARRSERINRGVDIREH
jgi:hypothetical protein